MILRLCLIIFVTQIIFIYLRTLNVRMIANHNMLGALVTGTGIHLAWLVSIAIGAVSMHELISNFNIDYVPVVLCSTLGGLLGTYWGLKTKFK